MAKTRGRPRKFSGPLRKGQTSIRGLNKKEKAQVETKIESAIKKTQTLKYFNASAVGNTAQHPEQSDVTGGQHLTEVSVIGYSSTGNEVGNATPAVFQKYGPQNIVPLLLTRPFKEFEADGTTLIDEKLRGNRLQAYYCAPKVARTMFSIERVAYEVTPDATVPTDINMARSLPIMCRMIKVSYKTQAGTQQELKPSEDLFLDVRTNVETGVDDVAFSRLQAKHAKVNSLKYKTLEDKTFVINQNNIITPNIFNATTISDIVTQKNGPSMKYVNVNFQLSQRKGQKLFFENPEEVGVGPIISTSGGQRQLLLYHFWYENAHNLVGGDGQPDAPGPEDIQIKFVSRSAFVDTQ